MFGRWAFRGPRYQGLSVGVGLLASVMAIGALCFGVLIAFAVMSDLVGSRLAACAILISIAIAVAAVVLAAHRSLPATDAVSVLSDWAWSFGMVLGGLLGGFQVSFWIVTLLFSLAEHRLLPHTFGNSVLAARLSSDRVSVLAVFWLAPQLGWIVPVALRIYRDGMARAVDAFRLAVLIGLCGGLVLSVIALVALVLLGPVR